MDDSHSIRDRFPFKRTATPTAVNNNGTASKASFRFRTRHHNHGAGRLSRKSILFARGRSLLYVLILCAAIVYVVASVAMQSSIASSVWRTGERGWRGGRGLREGLRLGSGLRFVMQRRLLDGKGGLDRARRDGRVGVRPPRIALMSRSSFSDCQFWELLVELFGLVSKQCGSTTV